jgi:hypothetical protein
MASRCHGFSRRRISIDWRKQPVSVSVLSARIIQRLSEETAQGEDSHPLWFVQPSANCRNLGVASTLAESSFQRLTGGALIAI